MRRSMSRLSLCINTDMPIRAENIMTWLGLALQITRDDPTITLRDISSLRGGIYKYLFL